MDKFNKNVPETNSQEFLDYGKEWEHSIMDDTFRKNLFRSLDPKFGALTKSVVELVAEICTEFEYSAEIEFTTYSTLTVFFAKYITAAITQNNKQILMDFKKEIVLKVFNVSMICAKYVGRETPIPLMKMVKMLQKSGYKLIAEDIKASEYDVYRLIDFKVFAPVAFHTVHFLVRQLCPDECQLVSFLEASVFLLRFVYLERELIFERASNHSNLDYTDLKNNEKFLAIAVLLTAAKIIKIHGKNYSQFIERLLCYCGVSEMKLTHISDILYSIVIKE